MRPFVRVLLVLLVAPVLGGCGDSGKEHFRAKGHVVKGRRPYRLNEGEGLRIVFTPLERTIDTPNESFAAEYQRGDGSFQVGGKDGTGLPPGKYQVSLELMKNREDLFRGRLLGRRSPITVEVSRGEEVVIDLDPLQLRPELDRPGS
jgi:hypothetical protein